MGSLMAWVPKEGQAVVFSVELGGVVGQVGGRVTRKPKRIEIGGREETKPDITQHALIADNQEHKVRMLDALLRETDVTQALVFTGMKRTAAELTIALVEKGFTAVAPHRHLPPKEGPPAPEPHAHRNHR